MYNTKKLGALLFSFAMVIGIPFSSASSVSD